MTITATDITKVQIPWDQLDKDFKTMLNWAKKNAKQYAEKIQTQHDAIMRIHQSVANGQREKNRGRRDVAYRYGLINTILRTANVTAVNKAAASYRETNKAIIDILSAVATGLISAI